MASPTHGGSFATLTHARLRAAQGDVSGALRILRVILDVQPEHDEARGLLAELEGEKAVAHFEPLEDPVDAVTSATSRDLKQRFKGALGAGEASPTVRRLADWLALLQRNRGARHAE